MRGIWLRRLAADDFEELPLNAKHQRALPMAESVTVAIPTYNGDRHLGSTIRSAIETGARVLISDDASTDATADVARSFGHQVTLLTRERNAGIAANYQLLLERCETPLALFLNQDDVLYPRRVQRLRPSLSHVTVLNSWIIDDKARKLRLMYRRPPYHALVHGVYPALRQWYFFRSPSQAIFPVQVAIERGGFLIPNAQGQGAEDWMFWLRLASAGIPFRFHMWPRVAYRVHSGNYSLQTESLQNSFESVKRTLPGPPAKNRRLEIRW